MTRSDKHANGKTSLLNAIYSPNAQFICFNSINGFSSDPISHHCCPANCLSLTLLLNLIIQLAVHVSTLMLCYSCFHYKNNILLCLSIESMVSSHVQACREIDTFRCCARLCGTQCCSYTPLNNQQMNEHVNCIPPSNRSKLESVLYLLICSRYSFDCSLMPKTGYVSAWLLASNQLAGSE